jgi:DASS family divalent anion:Na+ symporter
MTLLSLTGTLPVARVLSGFGNPVLWLIFSAFLFSRAVVTTGLGMRVAYIVVRAFARSALLLAYSVAAAVVVLAPFVPSDTARGGGVLYPITRSLARCFDSEPGPTGERMGKFLNLAGFHANYTASAMFLTAMAANPLIASFALKIGKVDLTWGSWAIAASVPGTLSLLVSIWIIYRMCPPEIKDTTAARAMAGEQLRSMGAVGRNEGILMVVLLCVMAGWVTTAWHGVANAVVAMAGVTAILLTGVVPWDDLLGQKQAWDTLIWFAPIIMMAESMNELGVVQVLSTAAFGGLTGLAWPLVWIALAAGYVYAHYAFASLTAHTTAFYPGFLTAGMAAGVPPFLMALPLAFFSSLNAGLTHYGTGSAPIYFGAGYVTLGEWWRVGLVVTTANVIVWMGAGALWWKITGFW